MIVLGLDLSLASTGVARIDTDADTVQLATITSAPSQNRGPRGEVLPPTLAQRHNRLIKLRHQLWNSACNADLIVVEGPSYASKNGQQHDRSGLWWLIVDALNGYGRTLVEVPPKNRMKYATGKGSAAKDIVLAAVVRRYPDIPVEGNDQADALILAAMGARHLECPIEASLPQTHLAAMDGVHWPVT